ncbi:hypothetical protein EHS25_003194 [Saitozyma podzolica]|uniref:Uncharacterized protein n=1 Tax=Saitozyma podzolica TaxID=1890683 RepID=A0A427Y888_9TREE|nr:hypothetical protein EHS25_003194 [Saitozyma podzolica]
MAHLEEEVEHDLSHIHWSWPEAIAANPARSLATPDLACVGGVSVDSPPIPGPSSSPAHRADIPFCGPATRLRS